jgi:hypothetical protein
MGVPENVPFQISMHTKSAQSPSHIGSIMNVKYVLAYLFLPVPKPRLITPIHLSPTQ